MKKILWLAGLSVALVAAWGAKTALADEALEQPSFTLERQDGAYEFRVYEPYLVAEVSVDGQRSQAANVGFRMLAGYIFGANQTLQDPAKAEKMAMTSPVTQEPTAEGQWKVRFMMPKKYTLETLPKAKEPRIRFFYTARQRFVALRFRGSWDEPNLNRHRKQLLEYAHKNHLSAQEPIVYAFYNAPFVLPTLRRNEVMLALPEKDGSGNPH